MDKQAILEAMHKQGIIAVLRSESAEQAIKVAQACAEGGVELIEVTFSVPNADVAISALSKAGYTVGAGTVLTVDQAMAATAVGAQFIVAPTFDHSIAAYCAGAGVPYIPGCMTVNEMYQAHSVGCEVVKLFPSSEFSPSYIAAVHAPLPDLHIMPTGGVSLDNVGSWIAAGAFCVGVGGNLTKLGEGGTEAIVQTAKAFTQAIAAARK